jgi:sulfite exporter TauE/SafE
MQTVPVPISALDWTLAGAALTLGLGGSAHCLAMCSGIAAAATPTAAPLRDRIRGSLLLNGGRLLTYVVMGAVVGTIVAATGTFDRPGGVWWPARLVIALLIVAVALRLLAARDVLGLERLGQQVWRRVRPLTRGAARLPAGLRPLALGAVWGFLPCGLVYSALALAAASGSAAGGAMVMGVFGLTTLPAMEAMALGGSTLIGWLRRRSAQRAAGIVLLAAGLATAAPAVLPAAFLQQHTALQALDCLGGTEP